MLLGLGGVLDGELRVSADLVVLGLGRLGCREIGSDGAARGDDGDAQGGDRAHARQDESARAREVGHH
jgi:hypothetical protein